MDIRGPTISTFWTMLLLNLLLFSALGIGTASGVAEANFVAIFLATVAGIVVTAVAAILRSARASRRKQESVSAEAATSE